MKKAVYPIVWLLHWVGHFFGRIADRCPEWAFRFFFVPYQKLMVWSFELNQWAELDFWYEDESWMDDDEFLTREEFRPLEEAQAEYINKLNEQVKK